MCRRTTVRIAAIGGLAIGLAVLPLRVAAQMAIAWRHVGNSAMALALPSLATGAVDRVWYSPDGSSLYARTASGRLFETTDFERWQLITGPRVNPPAKESPLAVSIPEAGLK